MQLATKFRPAETAFDLALQSGYSHVELWLNDEVLARHAEVAAMAAHYPIRYVLHFPNQSGLSDKSLRQAVDLYRQLACSVMVIHEPLLREYAGTLYALDPGLTLAVENHFQNRREFPAWAASYSALTLDVEHLWKFTLRDAPLADLLTEVERFLSRHVDRLRHVHLPGYLPGFEEHRPMYYSPEMVQQVLTLLAEAGYEGFVVSETHTPFQNPLDLQADMTFYEQWSRKMAATAETSSSHS